MRTRMAFESSFDQIFASCDIGYKKPDFRFYKTVTNVLQLRGVDRIVFFDDRIENVEAARQAGWEAYLYTSIEHFRSWTGKSFVGRD
jgi:HAD superfamily hydrolase (TIGR01509 family)